MRVKPLQFIKAMYSDPAAHWPEFRAKTTRGWYTIEQSRIGWHWCSPGGAITRDTETYEQAVQQANEHHTCAVLRMIEEETDATPL